MNKVNEDYKFNIEYIKFKEDVLNKVYSIIEELDLKDISIKESEKEININYKINKSNKSVGINTWSLFSNEIHIKDPKYIYIILDRLKESLIEFKEKNTEKENK